MKTLSCAILQRFLFLIIFSLSGPCAAASQRLSVNGEIMVQVAFAQQQTLNFGRIDRQALKDGDTFIINAQSGELVSSNPGAVLDATSSANLTVNGNPDQPIMVFVSQIQAPDNEFELSDPKCSINNDAEVPCNASHKVSASFSEQGRVNIGIGIKATVGNAAVLKPGQFNSSYTINVNYY